MALYRKMDALSRCLYRMLYLIDSNLHYLLIGVFVSLAINLMTGLMASFPENKVHLMYLSLSVLFSMAFSVSFTLYTLSRSSRTSTYTFSSLASNFSMVSIAKVSGVWYNGHRKGGKYFDF